MSFIPPVNSELAAEAVHAREQELEAKAERYAATHPDDGDASRSPNLVRRIISLFRRTRR